jgi:hypothetical protein
MAAAPARTTTAAKIRIASFMVKISLEIERLGVKPLLFGMLVEAGCGRG